MPTSHFKCLQLLFQMMDGHAVLQPEDTELVMDMRRAGLLRESSSDTLQLTEKGCVVARTLESLAPVIGQMYTADVMREQQRSDQNGMAGDIMFFEAEMCDSDFQAVIARAVRDLYGRGEGEAGTTDVAEPQQEEG